MAAASALQRQYQGVTQGNALCETALVVVKTQSLAKPKQRSHIALDEIV
jgi:hypothetical protein